MDRPYPLPVPEIIENNLNHSFKFNNDFRKKKKPPKLYPKEHNWLKHNHTEAHAVSFRNSSSSIISSTPKSKSSSFDLSSSFYDKQKNESYFEQCYEVIRKLGEGSFGEVFKVRSKEDGKFYAVKKLRFHYKSESYRKEKMQEVRRYEEFSNNENCVTLYRAWEQDDVLFMQIELCRGSVEDYVEKVNAVSEEFIWSFLLDMLLALKSLHDKNLIHLDIKLDNILITEENHCKLADFGLVFDTVNTNHSRGTEGDSRYLAPELLEGNFCLANDIFSLGISLLELGCSLELPTNGTLWQELRNKILPEQAMSQMSNELNAIIRSMMDSDPAKRPTVNELLKHPKLKHMRKLRNINKFSAKFESMFVSALQIIKGTFLFLIFFVANFFKLRDKSQHSQNASMSRKFINVQHIDENSDTEDLSFKASTANNSRLSKLSSDDDNNNQNSSTPTLNNSIPRITPDLHFVNSTPLNHYNSGQDGLSGRKYRRDLTKACFETDDAICSPVMSRNSLFSSRNSSHDRDSFLCSKKLLFSNDELDEL